MGMPMTVVTRMPMSMGRLDAAGHEDAGDEQADEGQQRRAGGDVAQVEQVAVGHHDAGVEQAHQGDKQADAGR